MAGQTMARFFFQPTCPTWCDLCASYRVLIPGLNSGRLAVYSCAHVEQYMGTFRFEVPILQCSYLF